ncbi:hypothetical protein PIB30_097078, partial [Stylosanthes scabra]|nr:hypothetical protein [Stylosanthes scabra]
ATFAHREPYLDSFRVVVGLLEDNRRMGSGVIYYVIEKREKFEESDDRADSNLAVMKMQRYHLDDEPFVHPLHSVRFDPDCPYEPLIKSFFACGRRNSSKGKDPSPQRSSPSRRASPTPQYSPLDHISRIGFPSSSPKMASLTQG